MAAVLVGDQIYVANVGDSRAIALKGGKGNILLLIFFVSEDVFTNIQYNSCQAYSTLKHSAIQWLPYPCGVVNSTLKLA